MLKKAFRVAAACVAILTLMCVGVAASDADGVASSGSIYSSFWEGMRPFGEMQPGMYYVKSSTAVYAAADKTSQSFLQEESIAVTVDRAAIVKADGTIVATKQLPCVPEEWMAFKGTGNAMMLHLTELGWTDSVRVYSRTESGWIRLGWHPTKSTSQVRTITIDHTDTAASEPAETDFAVRSLIERVYDEGRGIVREDYEEFTLLKWFSRVSPENTELGWPSIVGRPFTTIVVGESSFTICGDWCPANDGNDTAGSFHLEDTTKKQFSMTELWGKTEKTLTGTPKVSYTLKPYGEDGKNVHLNIKEDNMKLCFVSPSPLKNLWNIGFYAATFASEGKAV